ncbi:hypothetical protein FGL97_09010 [Pseudomonas putida]|uniref:hypothetical protein n=1 Tax=Pseudomonas putida TaxID=303 RepID=UPI00159D7BF8|nr:hypothetical protein [Pseudomonas putida]NVN63362.1 hypothetical protein [Pseudomonas putida]NVN68355.1 hypothetical protein [Pseudomonas putida]
MNDDLELDKQRMAALRDVWSNPKNDAETRLRSCKECLDLAEKYGVDVRAMLAPYAREMAATAMTEQREAVAALDTGELTKEKLVEASRAVTFASHVLQTLLENYLPALDGTSTGNPP